MPESGERARYDGHKRRKGSKVHIAVDTLGHLLALVVTPADAQEREQVAELVAVQEATGQSVSLAYVDRGSPGDQPEANARHPGRSDQARGGEEGLGVVLLPRRWVVERSFSVVRPVPAASVRLQADSHGLG
jgi:transposase